MTRRTWFALALLVCSFSLRGELRAQGGGEDPRLTKRLQSLQREIEHLSAERDRLVREEEGVLGRLERLEADARLLDARVEGLRLQEKELALELDAIRGAQREAEEELALERTRLAATVRLLASLGPLGRLRPIVASADGERMAAGMRFAHELTSRHTQQVNSIRAKQADLELLRSEREAREAKLASLREDAGVMRGSLRGSIRERRSLLARLRRDEALRNDALGELERAKQELEQMVTGFEEPGSLQLDVRRFKGLLNMPSKGRVSRAFGDITDRRFGTRIPHPGWDVDAEFGARVRPVFDGKVVFADWFRGYGLTVIVDHGSGVHSVYAHLSAILAPLGTEVERQTVLGRVGDTGSLSGAHLYLEMRENGKASDPAAWIQR